MALVKIPTLNERLSVVRRRILAEKNKVATQPGSLVMSSFMIPMAASDVQQSAINYLTTVAFSIPDLLSLKKDSNSLELLATALNTTVNDVLTQISLFIDTWGDNYDETRKGVEKATGSILFGRINPPDSNITIGIGKIVKSGNEQQFTTTASVTMYAASAGSYLDPDMLMYVISVPAEAVIAGKLGNAPVDTINSIVTSVDGFNFVTNKTIFDGGKDIETDEEFGARLVAKWQAIGRLTKAGVKETIKKNMSNIVDVFVAKSGSLLSLRGSSKTDAYLQGRKVIQVTETFDGFNVPSTPNSIKTIKLPILDIVSVSSGRYIVRKDLSGILSGSVRSNDITQFTTSPTFPLTVTYTYDGSVEEAQNLFEDEQNAPLNQEYPSTDPIALTTAILVKAGTQVGIDYTAAITIAPGFQKTKVVNDVLTALSVFATDTFRLGLPIFVGDFDKVVESVEGVLRISGEPTKFNKTGLSGVMDQITFASSEYPVLNAINIL
jgi:hypothetical protein